MRHVTILVLCAAIALSGCDSGSSGGGFTLDSSEFDDAIAALMLGTIVVVGVTAAAVYKHQHRNFERYQPGLNLLPDRKTRAGKAFRVRAIVANDKGKATKSEWDDKTVEWSIAPATSEESPAAPKSTKRRDGATAAEFRVEVSGAYIVTFKAWSKDADTETAAPLYDGTVEVQVE